MRSCQTRLLLYYSGPLTEETVVHKALKLLLPYMKLPIPAPHGVEKKRVQYGLLDPASKTVSATSVETHNGDGLVCCYEDKCKMHVAALEPSP
jgi:hypothetical protein